VRRIAVDGLPKCESGERTMEIEERRNAIRACRESGLLEKTLGRPVPRLETKHSGSSST